MVNKHSHIIQPLALALTLAITTYSSIAEELGEMWGTATQEAKYYPIVNIPIPKDTPLHPGCFDFLPDGQLAVGTRRGDIYLIKGALEPQPTLNPTYHLFATGQDEIFGIDWKDGSIITTQFGEVTKITDTTGDGTADHYHTLTNNWGYAEGHEFAFSSKHDPDGNIWVALGLSGSYKSHNLFRGWAVKVTPEGKMIPVCSGLRSPGGVGANAQGAMFTIESQGPWNGSCSLKHLKPGSFLGHPASYNWYPFTDTKAPQKSPASPSRLHAEKKKIPELVPPAIRFPYIKMGRSISGFQLNQTKGKFGPFENQLFLGDYTLSLILRATTEKINGIWQGACYPFREGLATGIMNVEFSPQGQLIAGGFTTNRAWPVRGPQPYAIQRIQWSGITPFEVQEINIKKDGFLITFTKPVDTTSAADPQAYTIKTYTHIYSSNYGSPEVDHTQPQVTKATPSKDGLSVRITLDKIIEGHIHDFDFSPIRSTAGNSLLHTKAYYTVNEIPTN